MAVGGGWLGCPQLGLFLRDSGSIDLTFSRFLLSSLLESTCQESPSLLSLC